jgi:hypothetical protein
MARPDELTFAPLGGVGEIGMNLSISASPSATRSICRAST